MRVVVVDCRLSLSSSVGDCQPPPPPRLLLLLLLLVPLLVVLVVVVDARVVHAEFD